MKKQNSNNDSSSIASRTDSATGLTGVKGLAERFGAQTSLENNQQAKKSGYGTEGTNTTSNLSATVSARPAPSLTSFTALPVTSLASSTSSTAAVTERSLIKEVDKVKTLLRNLNLFGQYEAEILAAYDTGDCFFDSVVQGMAAMGLPIAGADSFDKIRGLRSVCSQAATTQKNKWFERIDKDTAGGYANYEDYIKKIENMGGQDGHIPIWGRENIEGLMLCDKYDFVLHTMEIMPEHYGIYWINMAWNQEDRESKKEEYLKEEASCSYFVYYLDSQEGISSSSTENRSIQRITLKRSKEADRDINLTKDSDMKDIRLKQESMENLIRNYHNKNSDLIVSHRLTNKNSCKDVELSDIKGENIVRLVKYGNHFCALISTGKKYCVEVKPTQPLSANSSSAAPARPTADSTASSKQDEDYKQLKNTSENLKETMHDLLIAKSLQNEETEKISFEYKYKQETDSVRQQQQGQEGEKLLEGYSIKFKANGNVIVSAKDNNCGLFALVLAMKLMRKENQDLASGNNYPAFIQDISYKVLQGEEDKNQSSKEVGKQLRGEMAKALTHDQVYQKRRRINFVTLTQELIRGKAAQPDMEAFQKANHGFLESIRQKCKDELLASLPEDSREELTKIFDSLTFKDDAINIIEKIGSILDSITEANASSKVKQIFENIYQGEEERLVLLRKKFEKVWKGFTNENSALEKRLYFKEAFEKYFKEEIIKEIDKDRLLAKSAATIWKYSFLNKVTFDENDKVNKTSNLDDMKTEAIWIYVEAQINENRWVEIYNNYISYITNQDVYLSADELGCLASYWKVQLEIKFKGLIPPHKSYTLPDPLLATILLVNPAHNHWELDGGNFNKRRRQEEEQGRKASDSPLSLVDSHLALSGAKLVRAGSKDNLYGSLNHLGLIIKGNGFPPLLYGFSRKRKPACFQGKWGSPLDIVEKEVGDRSTSPFTTIIAMGSAQKSYRLAQENNEGQFYLYRICERDVIRNENDYFCIKNANKAKLVGSIYDPAFHTLLGNLSWVLGILHNDSHEKEICVKSLPLKRNIISSRRSGAYTAFAYELAFLLDARKYILEIVCKDKVGEEKFCQIILKPNHREKHDPQFTKFSYFLERFHLLKGKSASGERVEYNKDIVCDLINRMRLNFFKDSVREKILLLMNSLMAGHIDAVKLYLEQIGSDEHALTEQTIEWHFSTQPQKNKEIFMEEIQDMLCQAFAYLFEEYLKKMAKKYDWRKIEISYINFEEVEQSKEEAEELEVEEEGVSQEWWGDIIFDSDEQKPLKELISACCNTRKNLMFSRLTHALKEVCDNLPILKNQDEIKVTNSRAQLKS